MRRFGSILGGGGTRTREHRSSAGDASVRSLFVDDEDAGMLGDDRINMLLQANSPSPRHEGMLFSAGSSVVMMNDACMGEDEDTLRREEEQARLDEENEIRVKREKARELALQKGLLRLPREQTDDLWHRETREDDSYTVDYLDVASLADAHAVNPRDDNSTEIEPRTGREDASESSRTEIDGDGDDDDDDHERYVNTRLATRTSSIMPQMRPT